MEKIVLLLAKELNIKPAQAEAALQLLDDGNTVPFICVRSVFFKFKCIGNIACIIIKVPP